MELRERLSCSLADLAAHLPTDTAVTELVLLSTCNRIELHAAAPETAAATTLVQWLADVHQIDPQDHLQATLDESLATRPSQIPQVEEIITAEMEKAGYSQADDYATAVRELFGLPEHLS